MGSRDEATNITVCVLQSAKQGASGHCCQPQQRNGFFMLWAIRDVIANVYLAHDQMMMKMG